MAKIQTEFNKTQTSCEEKMRGHASEWNEEVKMKEKDNGK